VLVDKGGRARVFDFGLARRAQLDVENSADVAAQSTVDGEAPSSRATLRAAVTEAGKVLGTPDYMAPEQLMGEVGDEKADQFSFCVALYQGLYGELPFKGQSIKTLVREMSQGKSPEVATSFQVPSRLRLAVLRGLRPDRAARYPSMDALLDELALQASRTRRRLLPVAVLTMLVTIAAVGGIVWKQRNAAHTGVQSIVILPLKNIGDPSEEPFVDRLTDALTTTVAQLSNAIVISYDSAARYKTSPKSIQEIGRELSVDAVVSGSAKRSGSRIQLVTQLTLVTTGRQLWTQPFEYEYGQLPMLQADMAAGLIAEVESRRISPAQEARLARLRSVKPDVYEAFLRGWLLVKRRNEPDLRKSIAYFQEALREDPKYAPAYVGLASAHMYLGFPGAVLPIREASRLATEELKKALSLDPKLGEAHAALSFVKGTLDWDWRAAGEEAKRAVELSPNDASAHARYFDHLVRMQRLNDALVEAKRAQRLDPLNPDAQLIVRWFLETKQYDRAIEEYRKAIELEPNRSPTHAHLAGTYHAAGRYQEALVESQKAYELSGNPWHRAGIAHMLVHLGRTAEAEKIIEEIKDGAKNTVASWGIVKIYAALKRKEETLKWLEYAYEAHSNRLLGMNQDEELAWLRSDPRFQDLVKRVGWPQ
jgi:TolB-like protein/Tfp pilus assembly protein PilF